MSGTTRCPSCDEPNGPDTTYCGRCGSPLQAVPVRFAPAAGDDEDPGPRRGHGGARGAGRGLVGRLAGARARSLWILAASVGGAAAIAGLVSNTDWFGSTDTTDVGPPTTPVTTPLATPSPSPVETPSRLPRDDIVAIASSTLEPAGSISYEAELTLDGDPATAWNDGVDADVGVGETLAYRFGHPVLLDRIRIINGYDKVLASGDDLWVANARVARVTIATDSADAVVTLRDTREPQQVRVPGEATCSVRLTIGSVHTGSSYDDVAVSEVEFIGIRLPEVCPEPPSDTAP